MAPKAFSTSVRSRAVVLFVGAALLTTTVSALPPPEDVPTSILVPFTPVTNVLQEDFELGQGDWTSGGVASTWAFGAPADGPGAAYSGVNAWGTNFAGNYNNNECSWVQSPAFTLPGVGTDALNGTVSAAQLTFKHWLVSENRYDGGVVQVSNDGGATWTIAAPSGGYPVSLLTSARRCVLGSTETTPPPQNGWSGTMSVNASDWRDASVDLTAYLGQTIAIRFLFGTDSSVVKTGWYLDDVLVQAGAGAFVSVELPEVEGTDVPYTPISTLYAEDFELGDGGWTAGGVASSWEFGTPSVVGPAGAYSGVNAWGTNIDGNYSASECSALVSPPIALPGAGATLPDGVSVSAARVAWKQWFSSESRYDGGILQVSADDGASWTTVALDSYALTANTAARACHGLSTTDLFLTGTLSTKPDEWLDTMADLTPFLGQTIRLRLAFASDSIVHRPGWYVDDVLVQVGAGATVTPPALPTIGDVEVPYTELFEGYAEGFESGLNGWTPVQNKVDTRLYQSSWQHGVPAYASGPAAVSGKVWGTNLAGNYMNFECNALTSPPIAIGAAANVTMSWRQWVRTENSFDGATVEVSTDGGSSWSILTPWGGYPRALNPVARQCILGVYSTTPPTQSGISGSLSATSTAWLNGAVDLTAFAGQTVQVRYHFASDGSVNSTAGMYVDNVTVTADGSPVASFDFETDAQGWSAAATPIPKPLSWAVGAPTAGPGVAAEGASALATKPAGNYSDGECTSVESPVISLADRSADLVARMTTSEWFDSAGTGDGGIWQMRIDGGNWTTLVPDGGYPATLLSAAYNCFGTGAGTKGFAGTLDVAGNWTARSYNLTNASGHEVQLRAFFGADTSGNRAGWYVDDVRISLGAGGGSIGVPVLPEVPPPTSGMFDARLLEALSWRGAHAEDRELTVVIGGPKLEQPERVVDDRIGLMAYYEAQSAPWIEAIEAYVTREGGSVRSAFAAAPAVVATLPRDAIVGLQHEQDVQVVALDDEKSVFLIEPVPCDCPAEDGDVGAQNEQSVPMTQAPDLWALGYRGEGVKLSIIDTGIDGTHEIVKDASCASRIVAWRDFIANLSTPYDDQGHGTHVTGTAAGSTACGGRANGVAPKASIMGAKFLNSGGSGSFENGMAALQWSFDNGADVTSNSWGSSSCSASLPTLQLVNNLARGGMVSAFAAGNSGPSSNTIGGPGCADLVVTVGSVDKSMVVSSFSSRGPCADPTEGGVSRVCPDVVAVGSGVVSSVPRGTCSLCNPTGYRMLNGTSMATPHVGGALALMTQFKLALTGSGWDTANKAEETALRLTAIDLGAGGDDSIYGSGFIQLMPIYNLIANPGVPDVRDIFTAPGSELRVGQSAALGFRVSNAGTRAVDGHFTVTLTTPDGTQVLADRDVTLDFGGGASHASTFAVGSGTAAGVYTFAGSFVYSWVDDEGVVHTGEIVRSATFAVKKVDVRVARAMAATTSLVLPNEVVLTIENRGNEDALNVTVEEIIRDSYHLLPGEPDAANTNWIQGGTPAPSEVRHDTSFGRWTLVWALGDFPAGTSAELRYSTVATKEGTFPFIGVAKYKDGLNRSFTQAGTTAQVVTALPSGLPAEA